MRVTIVIIFIYYLCLNGIGQTTVACLCYQLENYKAVHNEMNLRICSYAELESLESDREIKKLILPYLGSGRIIPFIRRHDEIEVLDMSFSGVDRNFLEVLTELLPNVREVNLKATKIRSLDDIRLLLHLKNLSRLTVDRLQIESIGLQRIQDLLPNVEIIESGLKFPTVFARESEIYQYLSELQNRSIFESNIKVLLEVDSNGFIEHVESTSWLGKFKLNELEREFLKNYLIFDNDVGDVKVLLNVKMKK